MTEKQLQQTIRKALVHYKRWQSGEHRAAISTGNRAKADAAMSELMRISEVLAMIDAEVTA